MTLGKVCLGVARKIAHNPIHDLDALGLAKIRNLRLSQDLAKNACIFDVGPYDPKILMTRKDLYMEDYWQSDISRRFR